MVAEAVDLVAEGCRVAHPRRRMRLDTMRRGARFDSPASPTQKGMCDNKANIQQTMRNSSRGTSTSRRPRSARSLVWRSALAERFRFLRFQMHVGRGISLDLPSPHAWELASGRRCVKGKHGRILCYTKRVVHFGAKSVSHSILEAFGFTAIAA